MLEDPHGFLRLIFLSITSPSNKAVGKGGSVHGLSAFPALSMSTWAAATSGSPTLSEHSAVQHRGTSACPCPLIFIPRAPEL